MKMKSAGLRHTTEPALFVYHFFVESTISKTRDVPPPLFQLFSDLEGLVRKADGERAGLLDILERLVIMADAELDHAGRIQHTLRSRHPARLFRHMCR